MERKGPRMEKKQNQRQVKGNSAMDSIKSLVIVLVASLLLLGFWVLKEAGGYRMAVGGLLSPASASFLLVVLLLSSIETQPTHPRHNYTEHHAMPTLVMMPGCLSPAATLRLLRRASSITPPGRVFLLSFQAFVWVKGRRKHSSPRPRRSFPDVVWVM